MASRSGTFEETQQQSPFSRAAQRNMDTLLHAWVNEGETGFARVWAEVFAPGWETARSAEDPIRVVGDTGDCEERALEVRGAPDSETRVAAEWWYLFHTLGRSWKPETHSTRALQRSRYSRSPGLSPQRVLPASLVSRNRQIALNRSAV